MRRAWPTLLVAGLLLAWWLHPVASAPAGLALGDPRSEALVHLWGLWTVGEGLWTHGPLLKVSTTGWPEGFTEHLMDPANLVFFLPFQQLGAPVLGWNAVFAGALLLGLGGTWLLGRELLDEEDPGTLALLVLACVGNAWWLQHAHFGRTELLPALAYPLHLALWHRGLRTRSWGWTLAAGAVLGWVALGGWYAATFALLLQGPILIAWTRKHGGLERSLAMGGLALAMVLPALWVLLQNPVEAVDKANPELHMPTLGANGSTWPFLSQLRLPLTGIAAEGLDQVAYPGLVALGLGLGSRRAWPWVGLALALLAFACGPFLVFTTEFWLPGPVKPLMEHTPLKAIQNWNRLGCLVGVPAGVGAALGWQGWVRRWPSLRRFWALPLLAVLADNASWPRWSEPQVAWDPSAPTALLELAPRLPEGPLLHLPIDRVRGLGLQRRGDYLVWSLQHGRPVTAVDDGNGDALVDTRLVDVVLQTQSGAHVPNEHTLAAVRAGAEELDRLGVAALVLHTDRVEAEGLEALLTDALGPPAWSEGALRAWDPGAIPASGAGGKYPR